jgi:hypothetical protein
MMNGNNDKDNNVNGMLSLLGRTHQQGISLLTTAVAANSPFSRLLTTEEERSNRLNDLHDVIEQALQISSDSPGLMAAILVFSIALAAIILVVPVASSQPPERRAALQTPARSRSLIEKIGSMMMSQQKSYQLQQFSSNKPP